MIDEVFDFNEEASLCAAKAVKAQLRKLSPFEREVLRMSIESLPGRLGPVGSLIAGLASMAILDHTPWEDLP